MIIKQLNSIEVAYYTSTIVELCVVKLDYEIKMNYLRKEYNKIISDRLLIKYEDLSDVELSIIDHSFDIIESKVKEMKELNDEIYRLNIEIKNIKSYQDDKEY